MYMYIYIYMLYTYKYVWDLLWAVWSSMVKGQMTIQSAVMAHLDLIGVIEGFGAWSQLCMACWVLQKSTQLSHTDVVGITVGHGANPQFCMSHLVLLGSQPKRISAIRGPRTSTV